MIRANWMAAIGLTIAAWIFSAVVYPSLPEQIPTHWNIRGEIDGYGAKSWGAFLAPGIMLLMLGIFRAIPWLSPKHFEIDTFRTTYSYIVVLMTGLFAYIHVLVMLPAMGYQLRNDRMLIGGMMLFFILLGNVLGKVQRNFFVGVRTPWTLASERVWNDTHRIAAWVFCGVGVLGLASVCIGLSSIVPLVLIGAGVIVILAFSLVRYKQLERRGEL
jgi:uncharacterized membrane protein